MSVKIINKHIKNIIVYLKVVIFLGNNHAKKYSNLSARRRCRFFVVAPLL